MSDSKITTVTGGSSGTKLVGCLFRPQAVSTIHDFYDSSATTTLGANLSNGGSCDFSLAGYNFTIFNLSFSGSTVTGKWRSRGHSSEEGTFQAQAGGHGDPGHGDPPPESTSSATA